MLRDYFRFALGTLSHRKLRSWLTMIGIFIGIAAVVALISLGKGFEQAINREFEKIGTDKLIILPKTGVGAPGTNAVAELTEDDLDIVKRVSGIENTAGFVFANSKVEFDDNIGFFFIIGLPEGDERDLVAELQSLNIREGRNLRDNDRFSALLGSGVVDKELLGKNINIIADKIKSDLRRSRDVKKDEEDFDVQTPEQLLGSFGDIIGIVQSVLIGIAAISLLVGGIGIANTMYTAVVERTKEIGIMKSIGAQNKDILLIFVIESGLLGALGGLIGIALGFGLSFAVEAVAKNVLGTNLIGAYFSYSLFFGALMFSFLLGAVFGVMPAKQAASLQPVDALRGK